MGGYIKYIPPPPCRVYYPRSMALSPARLILNTWAHAPERANKVADDPPLDPSNRAVCIEEILRLVTGGTYLRDACEAVGVGRDTFLAWRLKDAELSRRYFEARASWALVRLDDALEQLAHATTPVAATKWRTVVQALQWESERLLIQYRTPERERTPGEPARTIVIRWESSPGEAATLVLDAESERVESPSSGIKIEDGR